MGVFLSFPSFLKPFLVHTFKYIAYRVLFVFRVIIIIYHFEVFSVIDEHFNEFTIVFVLTYRGHSSCVFVNSDPYRVCMFIS